jgi:hypothetical protein
MQHPAGRTSEGKLRSLCDSRIRHVSVRCAVAAEAPMVPAMMEKPPAKRALDVAADPPPTAPIAPKRISAEVGAAIGFMVNGDCKKICEAAEKAGLAREGLSRALSTPHVAEHLRLQTVRRLGIAAARAGHTKVELLDSDSEIVRDRASSFVLGLAGIQPASTPSVSLNVEIRAGYIIDISPEPSETIDLSAVWTIIPRD